MQNLTFIIGAMATGKSFFINSNYANQDVDILNVYDYQQRVYVSNRSLSQVISADYFRRKRLSQSAVDDADAHYIG